MRMWRVSSPGLLSSFQPCRAFSCIDGDEEPAVGREGHAVMGALPFEIDGLRHWCRPSAAMTPL